ncbi:MAG TPA: NUDIX domain-containing protein [Nocardioidaceae bacterium]|nr:NUDIX domain-containing protein [Nocardioidaceae bacterium]
MTGTGVRLHADALRLLRAWTAPDPRQEQLRRRYVRHLEDHADGVLRGCFPDHLTASSLIVSADAAQVLLTLHAKAGAWFQTGGHCEATDTTLAGAALREAVQESGIDGLVLDPQPVQLDCHEVGFCDPRGAVRHLDVRFLAVAAPDAVQAVSAESLDVRWWPADALPTDEPSLRNLVRLARARLALTDIVSISRPIRRG